MAAIVFVVYRWTKTDAGATLIDRIRIATAGVRQRVAEVPGGAVLADAVDAADGRFAAGAVAGDGGAVDRFAADRQGGVPVVETVREGKGLSVSLQATKVFPELAIEMIEVGESTGALPQMLNSVAEFFEEDVQTNLTAAMSLIEPLILIVMGVVVVTILIALYLPIFSLSAGGMGQ